MSLFDEPKQVELVSQVKIDETVKELSSAFDYPFTGTSTFVPPTMPTPPEGFGIGLIVGPSGTGKSTILKQFGSEETITWDPELAVCSHFNNAVDARERLSAVGFNSIPAWMRPYHVLSTGEKFRADLARRLRDGAVIDEFTSVVDRNVAKSCANSIRRYVDQKNIKGLVFASCHYDIIEWLRPDWVFDTSSGRLTARGYERRPEIVLEMLPCSTEAWTMFRNHHYLDGNINKGARCWIAVWDGTPVGFSAALSFPNGNLKNAWRGHRTVVLPDYQGLGLGVRISDATAEIFVGQGCRYFSKTAHPRMGEYRNRSLLWKPTSKNERTREDYSKGRSTYEEGYKMKHAHRFCYSHEYIGKR
jgi:GNAT superfamily N-acetyltransferase